MTNVRLMTQMRPSKAHCFATKPILLAMVFTTLSCVSSRVAAQGFSSTPSGVVGEVLDSNRNGLGASVRGGHAAGGTVGRDQSVSFLGVSPFVNLGDGLLFGDTRLSYANNGEVAWSFGGGYRQFIPAWDAVIGGYGYYDEDNITGTNFRQWSVGGEILAHRWEARANWYQPFGDRSAQTGSTVDANSVQFVGQNIQFTSINTFADALEGLDVEIGFLLPGEFSERFDVRAFGGAYTYSGVGIDNFSGFSTRVQADVGEWLELALGLTDDELFHTNVTFSAAVHFGGFESQDHTRRSAIQRLAEPVRRNLTIAAVTADVIGAPQLAQVNGANLVVAHVDSNAAPGGNGTVNSPFQSLQAGLASPADIVFTHAGSQFTAAPENSVTLANNQSLFGEGLITFPGGSRSVSNIVNLAGVGDIPLPASPTFAANPALSRPIIANSGGDAVVLGNNSSFGGFIIDTPVGNGILIDTVAGTTVRDTLIDNPGGSGILIRDSIANTPTTITDTVINSPNSVQPAFFVQRGAGNIGFTGTSGTLDPSFSSITNSGGAAVRVEDRTGGSVSLLGSTIDDTAGDGIQIVGTVAGSPTLGNVLIDNASISDSIGPGILISNADNGSLAFNNSIRPATTITNANGSSVQIDQLGANGNVSFSDLNITTPLGGGISIDQLAGDFTFANNLVIGAPGAGAAVAPALSVTNSLAGSSVQFLQNVAIQGSTGAGLALTDNAEGSMFQIGDQLTVQNAAGNSVLVQNNAGSVNLIGDTGISQRGSTGILVDNSTGPVNFGGTANVANEAASVAAAVTISNSESNVQFDTLSVQNALAGGGVVLVNNVEDSLDTNPATMATTIINTANITSTGGVGLFSNNTNLLQINNGTITTGGAAAVDIEDTGILVTLDQVNSTASPDFGIRLVETNQVNERSFLVQGDAPSPALGTGGTITQAGVAGVFLQNAGQVRLDGMLIDQNNDGVVIRNSGLAIDDDQFFAAQFTQISDSAVRGIDAENLTLLNLDNVVLDDNGLGAGIGRESILLNYTELLNDVNTDEFADFDNPFIVEISNSQLIDNSDDALVITQDIAAFESHLGVNLQNNTFQLTDTNDFDPADLNENAIEINWNGPLVANIEGNTFNLNGTNAAQAMSAFFVDANSTTAPGEINNNDLTELLFTGNLLTTSTQPNAFGVNVDIDGRSITTVTNNVLEFTGQDSFGFFADLGSEAEVNLTFNTFRFLNQGGTGIQVDRLESPATFQISGNLIELSDVLNGIIADDPPLETGIFFQTAIGPYTIFGTQNNVIQLLNPGTIDRLAIFNGAVNGSIIVNGATGP